MHYLIAGLGSIGRRHLKNIKTIDPGASVTVWHTHSKPDRNDSLHENVDAVVYSFDDAMQTRPDVALITNPAPFHIPVAKKLADEGIDLFIEKPLSTDLPGIDMLQEISQARKKIIMVGYNLRFHRPLQVIKQSLESGSIGDILSIRAEVGQYLPDWRPDSDYRSTVSARKELGGGVVFELSHELDYVRWLVGEVTTVSAHAGHLSNLDMDCEDTAEIILKFKNGAIGSVHLDMVQRSPARFCKIIGTEGTLMWEGNTDSISLFTLKKPQWSLIHPPGKVDRNEMYLSELRHFLYCVETRTEPAIGIEDGKRALKIALAVLRSSEENRSISL